MKLIADSLSIWKPLGCQLHGSHYTFMTGAPFSYTLTESVHWLAGEVKVDGDLDMAGKLFSIGFCVPFFPVLFITIQLRLATLSHR